MLLTGVDLTISTEKLKESKDFYTKFLGYEVLEDTDWYIELVHPVTERMKLCFKLPCREEGDFFSSKGLVLSFKVHNVNDEYEYFKQMGADIYHGLQNKDWGERSFVVKDPNDLLLYIYSKYEGGN